MTEPADKVPPRADELLPPVEPPSGAFLMQLFVIPAVIVAGIVGVWLLINSLARRDTLSPEDIVARLRSNNPSRFQVANDLADMLRMPERYPEVKPNRELAAALGKLLDEMVAEKDDGDASVSMRTLLCGFLGEFSVDDGLPALVATAKNDDDPAVRRKAIGSIAVLQQTFAEKTKTIDENGEKKVVKDPQAIDADGLAETLIAAANQGDDDALRSETAFALGVLASVPGSDARYTDELIKLLEDFYPDARYNAATGLARAGNLAAADTVKEMLDLDAIAGSLKSLEPSIAELYANESEERRAAALARAQVDKRDVILKNGLQAVMSLREKNPGEKLEKLAAAIDKLLTEAQKLPESNRISPTLLTAAQRVRAKLGER